MSAKYITHTNPITYQKDPNEVLPIPNPIFKPPPPLILLISRERGDGIGRDAEPSKSEKKQTNEKKESRKVKKTVKHQETMMEKNPRLSFDDGDSDLLTYKEKGRYHKTKERKK